MTVQNGWTVTRVRCPDGTRLWNCIKPGPMTKAEFEDNGEFIKLYYRHLLTCPNCGRAVVVNGKVTA